uniref:Zinc finger translocation associated n=1 Tax=Xiphophorus couchianus TaxID=32473 RepID=A0A3B5L4F3_9TELE
MEEKETGESEPVDLRSSEQSELLSLIISGEEETTQEGSDLGDNLANGHGGEDSETGMVTPVRSPATSYWSITEGPDHPLLLSPAPGPSGRKPRVQRASRPGLSRIPGRDHRRYYHEYWRSEYLMDFDPQRHGMICMVCGSTLATLKLSTIKRHIRQKHPDSLLWSAADKEVIRSGWESHLEEEDGLPGPSARTLERYLNDSLHAWFRQEFLMEYEAEAGRLLCMVCGAVLPSLHLDHIKSHVLETHPNSLVYSSEEKHCILQAWAQTHGQPLRQSRKRRLRGGDPWRLRLDYLVAYGPQDQGTFCMVCSQVLHESKVSSFRRHIQECHPETTTLSRQEREAMAAAWTKHGHYPGKDQRRNYQVRWRMEYLMDYDCRRHGLICMVCGATLATLKVSTIKRHIQQVHPHSLLYGTEEKEQALLSYSQTALHFVHSDDCFSSQDHGLMQ